MEAIAAKPLLRAYISAEVRDQVVAGDVLMAQGNGAEAMAAYRKAMAATEAMAAKDPANTTSQRDLSISHLTGSHLSDVSEEDFQAGRPLIRGDV